MKHSVVVITLAVHKNSSIGVYKVFPIVNILGVSGHTVSSRLCIYRRVQVARDYV